MDINATSLVAAAKKLLEDFENQDEFLALLADYVDEFERWRAAAPLDTHAREELEELNGWHSQVLTKATALRDGLSQQYRDMRVRGRHILSYIDNLPGRISITRTKRG